MGLELEKYPYFVYPMISELKACGDPVRIARLKELIAANVGDSQALISLLGAPEADFRNFYPNDDARGLSTDATIDSFLSRFGGASELPPDSPLFATQVEENFDPETAPVVALPPQEAVEEKEDDKKEEERQPKEASQQVDTVLSLERVKILVKNRHYEQALEILEAIYLNNPKKSIYFADQIRFIKKMMLNESKKTN